MASDLSDNEGTDPGYRSRSQSRRARRKKQTKSKQSMPAVPEDDTTAGQRAAQDTMQASADAESRNEKGQSIAESNSYANMPEQSKPNAMQPFEWIGPDSTSMNGPVTYAKAMRGEIPMRPGNPDQSLATGKSAGESGGSDMMDQEGLKLRIELNIDIEIELKARIHGDLTLALLS